MAKYLVSSHILAETAAASRGTKPAAPMKKLLTGLTAVAIAMSLVLASAVPSRADKRGDDLAKVLAAALVIGVIVNSIDNNRDAGVPEPVRHGRKQKPQAYRAPHVPNACAIEIGTDRNRSVVIYAERCLRREGFNYRLPDCARIANIRGRQELVYPAQCLQDAGFETRRGY